MALLPEQPKFLQSLMHAGQGGVQRTIEALGDLTKTLAFIDALANDFTLLRRQLIEQPAQSLSVFTMCRFELRTSTRIGDGIVFLTIACRKWGKCASALLLSLRQQRLVKCNREQPATQMIGIDAAEPFQGTHERLL